MNARAKTHHSPGSTSRPLVNVDDDVSVIAAQCEEVLLRAGFRFAHCGGSFVIFGPGENCRPASCELIAELLTQHAEFGTVGCSWEARNVPTTAVSELMSRVIAQALR
jgi:hypothetical protein